MTQTRQLIAVFTLLWILIPIAATAAVRSGPMAGYAEMLEVPLWVQLDGPGEVVFEYWPEGGDRAQAAIRTAPATATAENDFVVTALAGQVLPGMTYRYAIRIDGSEQQLPHALHFRTPPNFRDRVPPPDLRVAVVSGLHRNEENFDPPFRTPGGGYHIFEAIAATDPQLVIWPGGTMALREPDWGSASGYRRRAAYERELPELQSLLGAANHIATWGASDFGPLPADKRWRFRHHARNTFELFWPRNAVILEDNSMVSTARWSDVEFFILDDRTNRTLDAEAESLRKVLGDAQLEWLLTSLSRSTATFKVVVSGSPLLNPAAPYGWQSARTERDRFFQRIGADRISGLLFICGDRPFGEVTRMVRANGPDLYEFSVGPATARPVESTDELNYFRIPGSARFERQFGLLQFGGPEDDRSVTISIINSFGETVWSLSLKASVLGYGSAN